jgi:hypothetical protein
VTLQLVKHTALPPLNDALLNELSAQALPNDAIYKNAPSCCGGCKRLLSKRELSRMSE